MPFDPAAFQQYKQSRTGFDAGAFQRYKESYLKRKRSPFTKVQTLYGEQIAFKPALKTGERLRGIREKYRLAQEAFKYGLTGDLEKSKWSWVDILRDAGKQWRELMPGKAEPTFEQIRRYYPRIKPEEVTPQIKRDVAEMETPPILKVVREFGTELGGELLERGTKPSTWITWYGIQRLAPPLLERLFKKLPKPLQDFLLKERHLINTRLQEAYKTLGVRSTAPMKEIEKVFREKALKLHPDRPGGSEEAMAKLNAAYDLIKQSRFSPISKFIERFRTPTKPVSPKPTVAGKPAEFPPAKVTPTAKPPAIKPTVTPKPPVTQPTPIPKPTAPIFKGTPITQAEWISPNQVIVNKVLYDKAYLLPSEIEAINTFLKQQPIPKIPSFESTGEAVAYGRSIKGDIEQINLLKRAREDLLSQTAKIKALGDKATDAQLQQGMDLGIKAQFLREAIEEAEKPSITIKETHLPLEERVRLLRKAGYEEAAKKLEKMETPSKLPSWKELPPEIQKTILGMRFSKEAWERNLKTKDGREINAGYLEEAHKLLKRAEIIKNDLILFLSDMKPHTTEELIRRYEGGGAYVSPNVAHSTEALRELMDEGKVEKTPQGYRLVAPIPIEIAPKPLAEVIPSEPKPPPISKVETGKPSVETAREVEPLKTEKWGVINPNLTYEVQYFEPSTKVGKLERKAGVITTYQEGKEIITNIKKGVQYRDIIPTRLDTFIKEQAPKIASNLKKKGEAGKAIIPEFGSEAERFNDPNVMKVLYAGRKIEFPLLGRFKSFINSISRGFESLKFEPQLKGFPQFVDDIRIGLLPLPRRAIERGILTLRCVIGDLNRDEINEVLDIAYMRNFISRGIRGLPLPGGLTVDQVQKELARAEAKASPKILERVDTLKRAMEIYRQDLIDRGVLKENQMFEDYVPHYVQEYLPEWWEATMAYIPRRLRKPFRGYAKRAIGSSKDIVASEKALLHHFIAVSLDNMIEDWAMEMLSKYSIPVPEDLKGKLKPRHHYEIGGKMYEAYQYIPGRVLYSTQAFNPRLMEQALQEGKTMEEFLEMVGPRGGLSVREVAALGRYFKMHLVPVEIAQRLNKLNSPAGDIPFLYATLRFTSTWKRITLDLAGLPFHIGNFFGDALNLYLTAPGAINHVPEALRIIRTPMEKLDVRQQDIKRIALEKDVLSSAFISEYAPLYEMRKGLFAKIEKFSAMRESILRTAMLAYQYDRVKAGLKPYAPQINLTGLDEESAIAKIAREFTVDYISISPAYRRFLRGSMTPFIRFYEANARNWARYAKRAPLKFIAKIVAPILMAWVYNNTRKRKEIEEKLPQYHRWRPHLNLKGYDLDGDGHPDKAIIWSLQTPLDMAAAWIGMDRVLDKVTRIRTGELTVEEAARLQLIDMGLGAPRQIERLLNPMIQMLQGILTNRDPFTRRTIIPQELKGTWTEKKLWAKYVVEKLALPIAQYSRLERGTEPTTSPITDWLLHGPFDIKRALGFYVVDLTTEPVRVEIDKARLLRGLRGEYMYRIEQRIINDQPFDDLLREAHEKGIMLTPTDILNRYTNVRVRMERIKRMLRETTDPAKRKELEKQLIHLRGQRRRESIKQLPTSVRGRWFKEVSPK